MATYNGTVDDDVYTGTSSADTVNGNDGSDNLSGAAGADVINGGNGNDVLFSQDRDPNATNWFPNSGISTDFGTEVDRLSGGAGDDYIYAGYGDHVDGGTAGSFGDRLYISFQGATAGVIADFRLLWNQPSITIGGGVITNIQNIGYLEGSEFNDFLVAIDTYYPSGADVFGRGGDDYLIADYYSGWGGSGLYGGDGNDLLDGRGGQYGPVLFGDAGDDTIYAASGFGKADGGEGNDIINGGVTSYGGAGNDTINAETSYYSPQFFGNGGDDTINGSAGNEAALIGGSGIDTIFGNGGDDFLYSGIADDVTSFVQGDWSEADTGLEHDQLSGGDQNDRLSIGYGDDADGGGGTDILTISLAGAGTGVTLNTGGIVSGGTVILGGGTITGIEQIGTIFGSAFSDTITIANQATAATVRGGEGGDILTLGTGGGALHGDAGNDDLRGGAGSDSLYGGTGDDSYLVQNVSDQAVELSGEGNDTVRSSLSSYTLGANIETLVLAGAGKNGTGNALDNVLIGNGGHNILDGGAGADRMEGGLGDDTYRVDNANDLIVETGVGLDKAIASVSYTLRAGVSVETLTTDNDAGTAAINLTGNELANRVVGNAGANTLHGGGGNDRLEGLEGSDILWGDAGTDLLIGGNGNDLYVVTDLGDTIVETATGGTDRVSLSLATGGVFTLGAYVETLVVAGNGIEAHGNAQDNQIVNTATNSSLWGEGGNDTLVGGAVAEVLHGGTGNDRITGGAGNDTMWGEAGSDLFVFAAGSGADEVVDFTRGADRIDLTGYGVSSLAQVQAMLSQSGANAVIDLGGGNSITLDNIVGSQLAASDFVFAPAPPSLMMAMVEEAMLPTNDGGAARAFILDL